MSEKISGLYTVNKLAKERNISRQSAINLLYKLHKQKRVIKSKTWHGPTFYDIYEEPVKNTNGLYSILDKTPMKLVPVYAHFVRGKPYTTEQAIVDALEINEVRHQMAVAFLLTRSLHWTSLVASLKSKGLLPDFKYVYTIAQSAFRVRALPMRYKKLFDSVKTKKLAFSKEDLLEVKHDNYQ